MDDPVVTKILVAAGSVVSGVRDCTDDVVRLHFSEEVFTKKVSQFNTLDPTSCAIKLNSYECAYFKKPKLVDGQWHDLGAAAKVLKDAGLLAKSAPSTKLFRKHPHAFELQPEKQPNRVRFAT